jgi:hypothetical protein
MFTHSFIDTQTFTFAKTKKVTSSLQYNYNDNNKWSLLFVFVYSLVEEVKELLAGGPYVGKSLLDKKLVDGVCYRDEVSFSFSITEIQLTPT